MIKLALKTCYLLALTLFAQSAFSSNFLPVGTLPPVTTFPPVSTFPPPLPVSPLPVSPLPVSPLPASPSLSTFTFTDKHIYTTSHRDTIVNEYDNSGNWVSSIDMGPDNSLTMIKGLNFGKDKLLYASVKDTSDTTKVVAFNKLGQIQATYIHPMNISSNISYGKTLITNTHIFVANGIGIAKMSIGDKNSATDIISGDGFYDIALLESGNIVVADSYDIFEYTQEGVLVSQYTENDDNSVMPNPFSGYTDVRGIAFDESKGVYYVSMLGNSSNSFQLLKMNLSTHSIMDNVYVWYGDDMHLLENGNVLIGSRTQLPEIYTSDLSLLTTLDSDPDSDSNVDSQMFVTQLVTQFGAYVPPSPQPTSPQPRNVIAPYLFLLL